MVKRMQVWVILNKAEIQFGLMCRMIFPVQILQRLLEFEEKHINKEDINFAIRELKEKSNKN